MRTNWAMWTVTSMVIAAGAGMPALGAGSARRQIEAGYARYVKAARAHDVKGIIALTTPDFKVKLANGRVLTREAAREQLGQLVTRMGRLKNLSIDVHVNSLKLHGDEAIVDVTQKVSGALATRDGGAHRVAATATAIDTWARVSGAWRMKCDEPTGHTLAIDGQDVSMGPDGHHAP
jgi:ketosteroid isomerase-like protein